MIFYYFIYIYLLFMVIFVIASLVGGIYAFLADKSWATILMLVSVVGFVLILLVGFSGIYSPMRFGNARELLELLMLATPAVFLIGLFGFLSRSKKIHVETETLLAQKVILENKLTALNAQIQRKAHYNQHNQ